MADSGSGKASPDTLGNTVSIGKAGRTRPALAVPAPIAPGTAQVTIIISEIFAVSDPNGAPCAQGNCRAEAKVEAVIGYGAAFQEAFGEGQVIKLFFPVGMKLAEEGGKIEVQDRLEVNLMAPTPASGWFTVNSFSKVK
ncbi:hypothetical protein [Rufibacter soli]|jgi:hypothetical protein